MKTLFRLIVLVLLIAGWGLSALSLHVVRTGKDRIVVIPKQRLSLEDTYVDARQWTLDDAADHASLIERIVQSGHADQFAYLVDDAKGDVVEQLEDAVKNGPRPAKQEERSNRRGNGRSAMFNQERARKAASAWWDLGK